MSMAAFAFEVLIAFLLLGAAVTINALVVSVDLDGRVGRWIAGNPEAVGTASIESVDAVTTSGIWAVSTLLGTAMITAAGSLIAVRGPAWPSMGARYERRGPKSTAAAGDGDGSDRQLTNSAQVWDALDRGDDPTA
jgi:uncharacterized membrane protein (TIGR02234 family)